MSTPRLTAESQYPVGVREVVVEDAEWAEREAAADLEVLFDVFGYRGRQLLKTGRTI